jgi:hypothetical protein
MPMSALRFFVGAVFNRDRLCALLRLENYNATNSRFRCVNRQTLS